MSLTQLPAHSEAKIKLLGAYLEAYLAIISRDRHTDDVFLADLFCGPGMYAENKPGSPVVIGRMLGALHQNNPSAQPTVFLFNDKDAADVANAESYLRAIATAYSKLEIIPSTRNASEVFLDLIGRQKPGRRSKKFYFVDPFGYSQVKLADLFTLLDDAGAELLLFQPCSFMFRFSEKGTPDALAGFMAELSGATPWPAGLDIMGYIHHTKNLLRARLNGTHFVDSFTIQKNANTVFCLFFFTPHIRGYEKMLEAKWKFNVETGQGWHYSSGHSENELFSAPCAQTLILEHELERMLQSATSVTNEEIYRGTLEQGFLPKHSREILAAWQEKGLIRVDPTTTKKGAFHLSYKSHQKEGRIIRISKVS